MESARYIAISHVSEAFIRRGHYNAKAHELRVKSEIRAKCMCARGHEHMYICGDVGIYYTNHQATRLLYAVQESKIWLCALWIY